jgi:hypothetical protein
MQAIAAELADYAVGFIEQEKAGHCRITHVNKKPDAHASGFSSDANLN